MPEDAFVALSVRGLAAERDARRQREQETERQLKRAEAERLADFKKRLDTFQITDAHRRMVIDKIKRAFDQGETETMIASFPSSFCTDNGRAIINAGEPPINEPEEAAGELEPDWLATLPAGCRLVYEEWKRYLKPGGFRFGARIINFPGGKPGDVGLFFSWPKI